MGEVMGDDIESGSRPAYGSRSDDFAENGICRVDKTKFLRPLLMGTGSVAAFTRPHGFGKTFVMSMLRDFLMIDPENPGSTKRQERIFKGLEIMEDRNLCAEFMGRHPVIMISLGSFAGRSFGEALGNLAAAVSELARGFGFLGRSARLRSLDRRTLRTLMDTKALLEEKHRIILKNALVSLIPMLFRHFGRRVFVIVDDYDVPLVVARQN